MTEARVRLKRTLTAGAAPAASEFLEGELILNLPDRKLFARDSSNAVFEVGSKLNRLVIAKSATDGSSTVGEEALDVSIGDDLGVVARFRNSTANEFKLELSDDGGVALVVGLNDDTTSSYLEIFGKKTNGSIRTLGSAVIYTDQFNVNNLIGTSIAQFDKITSTILSPVDANELTRKDYVDNKVGSLYAFRAFTDCQAAVNTPDFTHAVSGTGAAFSSVAAGTHNTRFFGVLQFALGTVATNRGAIHSPNLGVVNFLDVVGRIWTSSARVACLVSSDATNRYTLRIGFLDNVTGEPVDGCYWWYTDNVNGGLWQCVCRSNNVQTIVGDSSSFVPGGITEYSVVVTDIAGTRTAKFYRRALGTANPFLVATITTNIPFSTNRDTGYGIAVIRSLGTAAVTPIQIDSFDARCEIASTAAWR